MGYLIFDVESVLKTIQSLPLVVQGQIWYTPFELSAMNVNCDLKNLNEYDKKILPIRLEKKYAQLKNCDMESLILQITKPMQLEMIYLFDLLYDVPQQQLAKLVIDSWVQIECPFRIGVDKLIYLFESVNRADMMSERDKLVYENLPDVVTVYRGVQDMGGCTVEGMSWTIDYGVGCWFAHRWDSVVKCSGKIMKAKIAKDDILCYTNMRNESEVILNPGMLKNLEIVDEGM